MSRQALEAKIKALHKLEGVKAENKIASTVIRDLLSKKEVNQCLIMTNRALNVIATGVETAIGGKIDRNKYITELKAELLKRHKKFPLGKAPLRLFTRILQRNGLYLGRTVVYIGESYNNIKIIIHKFNEQFLMANPSDNQRKEYTRSEFGNTINYDHGTAGAPVAMLGGVPSAMYIASRELDEDTLQDLVKFNFDSFIEDQLSVGALAQREANEYRTLGHKLIAHWQNEVDPNTGEFSGRLSLLIQPVDKEVNKDASSIEGMVYRGLLNSVAEAMVSAGLLDLEGSPTMRNKTESAIVNKATKNLNKQKNVTVTLDKKAKKAAKKTNVRASSTIKGEKNKGSVSRNKQRLRDPKTGRFISKEKAQSPINLMALINAKLPQTVAKNMGSPRLNYRTGVFAGSARVLALGATQQGHTRIDYTYQNEPYGVFEMGKGIPPWATPDRDPRKIIDLSIREIAANIMTGRLYTRRIES